MAADIEIVRYVFADIVMDSEWASREGADSGILWKVSPDEDVIIETPDKPGTNITFNRAGIYTATMYVSDGAMSTKKSITIDLSDVDSGIVVLPPGDVTVPLRCTIPLGSTVFKKVDCVFVTDNSYSMENAIYSYQSSLNKILEVIWELAPDVMVGNVGYAKGIEPGTECDLTTNRASLQAAINAMTTRDENGLKDYEFQMGAIIHVCNNFSWRDESLKIIIMASTDWQSSYHNAPYNTPYDSSDEKYQEALNALNEKGIQVYTIGKIGFGELHIPARDVAYLPNWPASPGGDRSDTVTVYHCDDATWHTLTCHTRPTGSSGSSSSYVPSTGSVIGSGGTTQDGNSSTGAG